MSLRRIIFLALVLFICTKGLASAQYIIVSIDSTVPDIPIFYKEEIFQVPAGVELKANYTLVFKRDKKKDAPWLLVTPPPKQDPTAEFIANNLKFAWTPLSEGLKLTVHISCVKNSSSYQNDLTFLSRQRTAFAYSKAFGGTDPDDDTPDYDKVLFQKLLKRNVFERIGRSGATATVEFTTDNTGVVTSVRVVESTDEKLNLSAMRTVIGTKFDTDGDDGETAFRIKVFLTSR